jgi:hypothetical protein
VGMGIHMVNSRNKIPAYIKYAILKESLSIIGLFLSCFLSLLEQTIPIFFARFNTKRKYE